MKRLLTFFLLSCAALGQDKAHEADPFADEVEEGSSAKANYSWPSNIAPTAKMLKNLQAVDLSKQITDKSSHIRFIWHTTADHPISIHVKKSAEGVTLVYTRMNRNWTKIVELKRVKLTESEWKKLVTAYSVAGARKPSALMKEEHKEHFIHLMSTFDGETWYLEVKDEKGYTVEGVPNPLDRDNKPGKSEEVGLDLEPFVKTCLALTKLADIKFQPNN